MKLAFALLLLVLAGCRALQAPRAEERTAAGAASQAAPRRVMRSPACQAPRVGGTSLRTLSRTEYNNTVHDLLGTSRTPADAFPQDSGSAAESQITTVHMRRYLSAAEQLAAETVTLRWATLLPCDPARIQNAAGEARCAAEFVRTFGGRAFRRPLQPAEVDELLVDFAEGRPVGRSRRVDLAQ